jgi:hypothetical protein
MNPNAQRAPTESRLNTNIPKTIRQSAFGDALWLTAPSMARAADICSSIRLGASDAD